MTGDYRIGGVWGCHVSWLDTKQFDGWDGGGDSLFSVYGHHPRIPEVGQTLVGEFKDSSIRFEFTEVDRQSDPTDMFFGKVKPIDQVMK